MPVTIEQSEGVVTAYLSGEIDHHNARPIREEIDRATELTLPQMLVLDFRDVTFMDSSGIGLVMGRYKLMQQIGGELHVTATSPQITRVMKLAGMDRLAVMDKGREKV